MPKNKEKTLTTDLAKEFIKHQDIFEKKYPIISEAYENEYGWPEMDTLRHEACLCIAFGLNQAAITLCNHMMESLLKYSLIYHHSINNEKVIEAGNGLVKVMESYTEEGIKKFGHITLDQSIKEAFSRGLIEEDEKGMLNKFRNDFRNAYSHADKEKTFGNKAVSVQSAKIDSKGINPEVTVQVAIAKNPIVHSLAQAVKAKQDGPSYFLYLDGLVRRMKARVFTNP